MKLKPKDPALPPVACELHLPGKLHADLLAYQKEFQTAYKTTIEFSEMLCDMLTSYLASDREFRRSRSKTSHPRPHLRANGKEIPANT